MYAKKLQNVDDVYEQPWKVMSVTFINDFLNYNIFKTTLNDMYIVYVSFDPIHPLKHNTFTF